MMFFQAVFQFPDIFLPARSSETTFRTMNKILYREGTMKNTVFFTTFVMLQFWNMFNAKAFLSHGSAFKNLKDSTGFLIVMFIIPIGQYLIVQFGGEVFRTVPLSWKDWGIIVGLTSLVLWIGEILRLMKKQ